MIIAAIPSVTLAFIVITSSDEELFDPTILRSMWVFRAGPLLLSWIILLMCLVILGVGQLMFKAIPDQYQPVQEQLYRRVP